MNVEHKYMYMAATEKVH